MKKFIFVSIILLRCFFCFSQLEKPDIFISQIEMTPSGGQVYDEFYWFNTNLASLTKTGVSFPSTGGYRFDLSAYAVAGSPSIAVLIDGVVQSGVGALTWTGTPIAIKSLYITSITAGTHTVAIRISNFSGSSHIRVGLLYFTRTSLQTPYVYPVVVPHNLPSFSTTLTNIDFGSKKLRGFSLGSNGTNQPSETRASMIAMKATGANIARCFVEIERLSGNTYTFKAGELIKLDTTLARAASLGFYVVPTMFHDPSLNSDYWGTSANSIARRLSIAILWKTIAAKTVGKAYVAALDLINEPRSNFNYAEVIRWEIQMLDTIRTIDPTHVVAVECISNNMFAMMLPLGYSNIIYSPHGYSPINITHQGVAGEAGANIRNNYPHTVATANQGIFGITQLSAQHDDVRIMSNRFHVPVFIGEFSCVHWAPASSTASKWTSTEWNNDNITLLEAEGWSWVYHNWARGGEAIEWDAEIPSSFYNAISFTNARPNTIASPSDASPTAPTIVMLEGWFGLNVATTCPVSGTTTAKKYHFSTLCGDDNRTPLQARNPATPWKTLAKATSYFPSLLAGDTLAFNKGETFVGALTVGKSGTLAAPIVVTSYGTGLDPVISSLVTVAGAVKSGNVWTTPVGSGAALPSTVNMLFLDGAFQKLGRYPNAGAPNSGYLTYESHTATSITDAQGIAPDFTGGTVVLRTAKFIRNAAIITSKSGGTLNYAATGLFTSFPPVDGSGWFVNRHPLTLDSTGEWYYATATKRLSVYSTAGALGTLQVPSINNLVTSSNFSFVTFNGLDFIGANLNTFNISGGTGWKIQNCDINYSGDFGILCTGDNLRVENSAINNSLTEAIRGLDVTGWYVGNNQIRNNGAINGMNSTVGAGIGDGIEFRGSSSTFELNIITNSGFCAIHANPVNGGGNIIIQNNFADTGLTISNDGGLFYTYNGSGKWITSGNVIRNNIARNALGITAGLPVSPAPTRAAEGIYLDNDSNGWLIVGNSMDNCDKGIYMHFAHTSIIRDNTTYNCPKGALISSRSTDLARNLTLKNNIFFGVGATQLTAHFESDANDIGSFFTSADSNFYARAINDNVANNPTIRNRTTNIGFAAWRTAFPAYDVRSKIAPRFVTNVNQLAFHYNATNASVVVPLVGNWVDVRNTAYSTSMTLAAYSSRALIQTSGQITPTVTWNNPAAITYPTALSATQLNATANVPGTFDYSPTPLGTVLNAGTQTLSVLFTPTDGSTYSTATKTVTIVVNKATASITYSNLTQTYTGLPLAPTITTSPSGLTVLSTTYNGVGATPINAGVYAIVTGLTNINYSAPTINGTFTINKAAATLTASNLSQVYNGSQRPITVVTAPVGLSGVTITYNGSATAPTNAGVYTVIVTLTNTNYTATQVNTTLTISKAVPTVTWSDPAAISYPTPLSGTQLNATASIAGAFTYTPPSGTILNSGTQILSVDFTPTDGANYQTLLNTTVTIVVDGTPATLTLSNLSQTYDGTGKSVTVTSNPAGLQVITVTYDGSTTLPINAGTYAVVATLANCNYTATPATGNLVISKATATISLSGLTKTYNGSPQGVTVTTVPAGLSIITTTYNGSVTAPTNAGSYAIISSLSNTNYQAVNATGTLVINKATPVITWNNPTAITYPTPLSGTQLNASANVAGSFAYLPPSGTILNAGTGQILSVDFTPTDGTNYLSVADVTVTITVNKATATLSLSGLAQDYDGTPKPVTVTSSPAGLITITVTYNGSGTAPTAVGTYAVVASLSNNNYTATNATGNLVISASSAAVTITDLIQTYTGSPLPVTVTVVGGWPTSVTYNGSGTVPTNVNTYTVIATINDGIHTGADTAIYNIIKATPSITWANPSAITYPTALSGTQLNASSAVAGVFTYTPASGVILNAGTQILSVSFAPTDATNYNSTSKTVSLVVNKGTATISLSALTQTYDGTPKSAIATTSPAGLDSVVITYDGSTVSPTAVGTYAVVATLTNSNYTATPATGNLVISTSSASITISNNLQVYTSSQLPVTVTTNPSGLTYTVTYNGSATVPTNAGSYTVIATITGGVYTGADTVTFVIQKATPTITWANPVTIEYPTPLGATQLNAVSSVAGSFVYLPTSGTILNVGIQNLSTTFTPTDAANYNTVVKIVTIIVNKATATLILSGLTAVYNGTPKSVTVTSTPASLSGIIVTYNGSTIAPTAAGSYAVVASLLNDNYGASDVTGTLVIAKANPILTWVNPTPIKAGTALSALQLNATSNIAGTFVYSPPAGSVLTVGTRRISATFTPTDITNYNVQTITVPISVFGNPFLQYYIRHGRVQYIEIP